MRKVLPIAAWTCLAIVVYATLSHPSLVLSVYQTLSPLFANPSAWLYTRIEHIGAFAILGLLFSVAYPRRRLSVCFLVLGAAALLEALQILTPDRHGTLHDYLEKTAGGVVGLILGRFVEGMFRRRAKHVATKAERS
jgi:VanZ family protein